MCAGNDTAGPPRTARKNVTPAITPPVTPNAMPMPSTMNDVRSDGPMRSTAEDMWLTVSRGAAYFLPVATAPPTFWLNNTTWPASSGGISKQVCHTSRLVSSW